MQLTVDTGDGFTEAEFFSQLDAGAPGPVFADEVVSVKRTAFRGHVYNLQTRSGIYVAGGILTHNCVVIYQTASVHEEEAAPVSVVKAEARCPKCNWLEARNVNAGAELSCRKCRRSFTA